MQQEKELKIEQTHEKINTISKEEFFSVAANKNLIIADPSKDGKIITFYSATDLEKKYKLAELDFINNKFIQYEMEIVPTEPLFSNLDSLSVSDICTHAADSDNTDL